MLIVCTLRFSSAAISRVVFQEATCLSTSNSRSERRSCGGGVYLGGGLSNSTCFLVNNIFWANLGSDGQMPDPAPFTNDIHQTQGSYLHYNSLTDGENSVFPEKSIPLDNIVVIPGFVNPTAGDYDLSASSPCIDKGTDTATGTDYPLPEDDRAGRTRPWGANYDMGACEFHGN